MSVVADLQSRGIETVILAGADTHGIMRGKRVPLDQLARLLRDGMAMCDVFWVLHVDEADLVLRPDGHEGWFPTQETGYPDILAFADESTVRMVPWHERTALLLCDWRTQEGVPVPISPRTVLARVVDRARAMGFEPRCALELEFYVLRESSASLLHRHAADLVPLTERPSTYGVGVGSRQEPLARAIREHMLAHGLPLEACNAETGPGQFEITLRYGPALDAADAAFLFKAGVKEIAAQEGLVATFMAKPRPDWAGSSCHIHISLGDRDGAGAFHDAARDDGMSQTMRHFAGGMLATMPEFTALMAPNPNSYRRLTPYSWAATTATWGVDNRSTGVRAILDGDGGTRLEHRQPGGDAKPYLALAAALAGGLHGVEQGIAPPAPLPGDAYAAPRQRAPLLPRTLAEATDLLADSAVARAWLGQDAVAHYVEMKRAELDAQAAAVTDWEIARYLEAL